MSRRLLLILTVLPFLASCRPSTTGDGGDAAAEAEARLLSGDWDAAATLFTEALAGSPDHPDAPAWRLGRGRAWLGAGRPDLAAAAADSLMADARPPFVASVLLLLAETQSASGRWSRCAATLARIDPEMLPAGGQEEAGIVAAECTAGMETGELMASRASDWLEPYVLLELEKRYLAGGDTSRALLTGRELDRLYPGFRERFGVTGPVETGSGEYIALVLPMTGEGAAYAAQVESGVSLRFERSADLVASLPALVLFDTRGETRVLEAVARELGEDERCLAVIGPLTSMETRLFAPYAQEYGLPILSPAATSGDIDRLGGYVHRLVPAGADEAAAIGEYAVRTAGASRLAILHSFTGTSVALAEQFESTVESLGAQVVRTEGFETDDTDFKEQIISIRAVRPDGIFLPVTAYEAVQIAPQLRFYSVDAPIFGTSGMDNEAVIRLGGEYVDGAVFTCSFGSSSLYPPTARFVFHYRRTHGTDPGILAAQGYDAASVLLEAWGRGSRTREDLEESLDAVESYRGACGICTIGAGTVPRVARPLVMVVDGEIVGVE